MDDPILNLRVTAGEAQTILDALGELPHKRVGTLSISLQAQAQTQLDKLAREQMARSSDEVTVHPYTPLTRGENFAASSEVVHNGPDPSEI